MVQTRFNKMNTTCDDCIIWTVCLFDCLVCVASAVVDVPEEIRMLADCATMSVNGCMHAQQHIEIEDIKRNGYAGPTTRILQLLPPHQQQMIEQGKLNVADGGSACGAPGTPSAPSTIEMRSMNGAAPGVIRVRCGGCQQHFGSVQRGVHMACPLCQTINHVP